MELGTALTSRISAAAKGWLGLLRLIGSFSGGAPGHGPVHLLLRSAARLGVLEWDRAGLLVLSLLARPIQHFRAAILDGWRNCVSADL